MHLYSTLSVFGSLIFLHGRKMILMICVCWGGRQCYIVRGTHAPGAHLVPLPMSVTTTTCALFSLKIHSLSEAAKILPL